MKRKKRRQSRATLNLFFPDGYDRLDRFDLTELAHLACGWRDLTGRLRFRFPAPFDDEDLVFADGETLTLEKAERLKAALAYFGLEAKGGGSQTSG